MRKNDLRSLRLLICFVTPLLAVRLTAQDCSASTGGGGEGTGSACIEINSCVLSPDRQLVDSVARPVSSGESLVYAQVAVPPAAVSTLTDVQRAVSLVANSGLVLMTGGEFTQSVELVRTYGYDANHPFRIGLNYRSYVVDFWRQPGGDEWGTVNDPFGPGWRASWGDMLVNPDSSQNTVTRVDEHGAPWTHTLVSGGGQPFAGPLPATYDGQAGVRIVYEYVTLPGGASALRWFKEWPDRSRTEYAATPGSGANLVAKRMYRGDYSSPDWEVVFTYTGDRLTRVTDARGIIHTLRWMSIGGEDRVEAIETAAPPAWGSTWGGAVFEFEYEQAAPYRLIRVRRPARSFVDDQDRSGTYDPPEQFNQQIVTQYEYYSGSNRIYRVFDESTGPARQMLEVLYDAATHGRVLSLTEGEVSSLPGQGQRVQSFVYPTAGSRTEWTDPRGVTRVYDFTRIVGGATMTSPRQWRVTRIEEQAGALDPRPSTDPHYHASLVWEFGWACGCGQLASIKLPSGAVEHQFEYDVEGRGLVTTARIVDIDSSNGTLAPQERHWEYEVWGTTDYRLASRLKSYTDALGIVGANTFTYDAAYGGYRVDGVFAGKDIFSIQEDAGGRVVWVEGDSFQVDPADGGGLSRARTSFHVGSSPSFASYQLATQVDKYKGSTVYSSRSYIYEGLGWMVARTDELSRTTTFTYDAVGWLRQATLPLTSSGRGSGSYTGMFTFEYDRYGQVAVSAQNAVNDQGGGYGRASIQQIRVFDYFSRPWKEFTDVADLGASTAANLTTIYEYDGAGRLVGVLASGGRETQYIIDDHNKIFQIRRKLDATSWSVEERSYHEGSSGSRVGRWRLRGAQA